MYPLVTGRWFEIMSLYLLVKKKHISNDALKIICFGKKSRWQNNSHSGEILSTLLYVATSNERTV
jgi:hypothetical protein